MFQKDGKSWSISLVHFIKHIPLISEEWRSKFFAMVLLPLLKLESHSERTLGYFLFHFLAIPNNNNDILWSVREKENGGGGAIFSFSTNICIFTIEMHFYDFFFWYSIPKVAGSPPVNERSIGNCKVLCSAKYYKGCCCWHIKSNRRHTYTLLSTLVYQRDFVKIENAVASWELGSS